MVQLSRLRLSGFKSFVDKTELDIGNGLNGIVGPNGCGKSNLVEALRWVMGENRARTMRGDGMEDVIFNGTTARPARNIAEVTLLIDNSDGSAPAPFGDAAQIEVTRRIERGKGSHYLVNGKAVRARDVQILFADALTGAHSPALVSQGRVAQIIQAKPAERRQMLEESAGVAALYTRRREAELRLNAAEENLSKLDLVIGEMQNRANSLRNQARQALRYSDLSNTIRRLEIVLAWADWVGTREKLRKEETRFAETDKSVQEAMLKASELTRGVEVAIEQAEESRKADIEARATLQLLKQKAETIEREIQHRK
ncbi:MAG TPA: AAA family ATPase, partial [Alphaproteobacteria bacterium]